jgi:branched-chain amino acid transport system substrate-binding protein
MAVDELNTKGGLLGKKIRLVVEDDQGRPEEAQTVVSKLVSKDRVIAVIGENASSRSLAAAPVCQEGGVPMISPSSTNPRVTQVGDFIFRVCFIDTFQGEVMAKFATNTLKATRVAVFRDIKNDYSVGLADVFIKTFQQLGGTIVADESYGEGDSDFNAQLTNLKSKNPEAIFVPGYYTEVGLIARQAQHLGLTVPLLGGDGWDSPKLTEIGGQALNGCYFSTHSSAQDPSPEVKNFVKQYEARFHQEPDANAVLGYDAMRILGDAIIRTGSTEGRRIRDALTATKNFPGVSGSITIDANRNAIKPAVVLRVNNGALEFVQRVQP